MKIKKTEIFAHTQSNSNKKITQTTYIQNTQQNKTKKNDNKQFMILIFLSTKNTQVVSTKAAL